MKRTLGLSVRMYMHMQTLACYTRAESETCREKRVIFSFIRACGCAHACECVRTLLTPMTTKTL